MKKTISILVENHAGVLSRICGLFSRRGFNIDSLAVGVTDDPKVSRITIVANGSDYTLEQLEKQFSKLGDTVYTFGKLGAEIHENIMLPASALNALRRKAVEALDNLRISRNTPHYSVHKINLNFLKLLILKYPEIRVQLHSFSQLNKYIIEHSDKIILPLMEIEKNNIPDNLKQKIIIEPPRFIVN